MEVSPVYFALILHLQGNVVKNYILNILDIGCNPEQISEHFPKNNKTFKICILVMGESLSHLP